MGLPVSLSHERLCMKKAYVYNIIIVALLVAVSLIVFLPKAQGIFFPQDEFGYWSNAARLYGLDWTRLARRQAEYAPGYSYLLFLLMKCLTDQIVMYRAAVILNGLMIILYAFLFQRLILKQDGEAASPLWSLFGLLYPCSFVYMHYTIAEVLLHILFMWLCLIVSDMTRYGLTLPRFAGGALCSFLLLMTHFRMCTVVFAFLLICGYLYLTKNGERDLAIVFGKQNRHSYILIFACVILLGAVSVFIVTRMGYFSFSDLLDMRHIGDMVVGVCGKLFYAGASSCGIALIGLMYMYQHRKDGFHLFFLLSFLFMALISSYHFIGAVRYDQIIYGRYEEIFIPYLIYLGLSDMQKHTKTFQQITYVIIFMGVCAFLFTLYTMLFHINEYVPDFVSGIDWMYGNAFPTSANIYELPFLIASIGLVILWLMIGKGLSDKLFLSAVLLYAVCVVFFSTWKHVYRFQEADQADRLLAERIEGLLDDGAELYFFNDWPYNDYVNLMQFWLWDEPIQIYNNMNVRNKQSKSENMILLTYPNNEYAYRISLHFNHKLSSEHFILYYNDL